MTDRTEAQADEPLEIRASLLGPAEITLRGQPVPVAAWPRRAPRSLLFMLLGSSGQRVARELVTDTLWPDLEPEAAANALYKTIHFLRRALDGPGNGKRSSVIALTQEFVGIGPGIDVWIDASAFERGIMTRSLDPQARRAALRQALQLYRGEFLVDEPYLDWPVARREALQSLQERAVLELAALDRDAGEPLATLPLLDGLIARDPLLEAAYQELIQSYLAAGDRDAATRVFQRCATVLRDELGEEPDARTVALLQTREPAIDDMARRRRLPVAPAPLVGRERELDRIEELFTDPDVRLVTLTGPGGVGKTRLSIEAAWQLAPEFADGALFVPLAPIRDGKQLAFAVANALGVRPDGDVPTGSAVGTAIDGQQLLLVLDNAEQVVEETARFVSELLAAARGPRLLVTSRERLHIRGEHELPVPLLDVPDAGGSATAIAGSDAVALFARLVRAHDPDFTITAENAAVVARICARLDGLPLSLELAASRARRMSPEALLTALDHPLRTLIAGARDLPDRHRTLSAAIAWSYDLLAPDEQRVFRALAVFAGGTTEAAMETIVPGGSALFDALADRSLAVWTDTVAGPRVSLLETIREFAEEAARAAGEWEPLRAAHACWMAGLVREAEEGFLGPEQPRWTERLDLEMGNFRRAVEYAWEERDGPLSATLIGRLVLYFEHRGHAREGFHWAERALALEGLDVPERIRLLRAVSRLGFRIAEFGAAEAAYEEARRRAEEAGDLRLLADVLSDVAGAPWYRANADQARPAIEQAYRLQREIGSPRGQVVSLIGMAMLAMLDGDVSRALAYDIEAEGIARRIGNPLLYLYTLRSRSITLAMNRELDEAQPLFEEGLRLAMELHDPTIEASFRHGLALVAAERGDTEPAIRGFLEVVEINRRIGHRQGYSLGLLELGRVEWTRGRTREAAGYLRRALDEFIQSGVERWAIVTYDYAASLLASTGDPPLAARLVGFADAARRTRHIARMELDAPAFHQLQHDLETALGGEALEALLAEGAGLADDRVYDLAREALDRVAGPDGSL